jgi:hypothetical protein
MNFNASNNDLDLEIYVTNVWNYLDEIFIFSTFSNLHTAYHTTNIDHEHSLDLSRTKPHVSRAGAGLRAKQVHLLQKLHGGAALR